MDRGKLIYAILKEVDRGIEVQYKDLDVELNDFNSAYTTIEERNYICGVRYAHDARKRVIAVFYDDGRLTEKGEAYLKENNKWEKGYNIAKEIASWVPFINPGN